MQELDNYLREMDPKWQTAYLKLLNILQEHIPAGFELVWQYEMPTFVVPLEVFPDGYLGRKDEGVPFISLAAQKRHLSLYHMGLMGNPVLLDWFQKEYQQVMPTKLNMGKSCIRLTNPKKIPYELLGELAEKISAEDWLEQYKRYVAKRTPH
ncbi:DUF1801 domain-containing protein [Enterococcus pseudoavium]|uniref:DUF1801 domain-containing protein n=1 Tax=Enterococcus pseudoavium TaxID=44007 RepID=A0AAE4L270_9ENTE|nr:DUF1801 domain-containing protein [Enterococcus pseudoavium]MDT2736443.1 DUF1801 domain-containing protein [Enterococcus pseudoavium]